MLTTEIKTKSNLEKIQELQSGGVITYSGAELAERKKNDWQESKQIVGKLYPRKVRN